MNARRQEILSRTALVLASLGLGLLALEAAARLARRGGPEGKGAMTVDRYMDYDPLLGWRKRPGARVLFREPEYTVEVPINSHGLRDPERGYEAAPGALRILALGDSFVEGYTVPLGETVTQVLEASLARPGCPVEVVNGGTAGYSTDQEYLFYKTEGSRYGAKVVLLFFYFNDVLYNAKDAYSDGDPKPLLRQEGNRLVVVNEPVPRPRPPKPVEAAREERGSALLALLRSRLRHGAPRAYNALAALHLWPPVARKPPPAHFEVYRRSASPEIREAWDQTARILRALAAEAEASGGHLLLVYVPSRMEVSDRAWDLTRFEYGMREDHWDRGRVLATLQRIGREAALGVLDLTPALRRVDRGVLGGPYFTLDGHWDSLGHGTAAGEVAGYLRRQQWLPECAR